MRAVASRSRDVAFLFYYNIIVYYVAFCYKTVVIVAGAAERRLSDGRRTALGRARIDGRLARVQSAREVPEGAARAGTVLGGIAE